MSDAIKAMIFYHDVFDGIVGDVYDFPNRKGENEANIKVGHVNLRFIDENKNYECFHPKKNEVDSIWLQITVDNVEEVLEKAHPQCSIVTQEIAEFMGTKHAIILDPFGYTWTINQIIDEISLEERYAKYQEMQAEME
ncbi:VOC family protein [Fundicoccus sp. Sow4_H7]|uniref:VOC family protein n=1 Tax=Fundicoccus sp. Sow4_H7 TaxID=3438784 RepID=UPI003F9259C2